MKLFEETSVEELNRLISIAQCELLHKRKKTDYDNVLLYINYLEKIRNKKVFERSVEKDDNVVL